MAVPSKKTEKISAETLASVAELSAVLGLSSNRIYQLSQDGVISSAQRGKYPLADSVQRYIAYLGRDAVTEDEVKLQRAKQVAETRLKTSKAKIAQMEAQELEGKMHRSEDVAAMTEDLIFEIRGALIALPGRLAVDVAACTSAAEAAETVRREVYQVMSELSRYQYDPAKYAERVRERMKWDGEVVEPDE